MQYLKKLNFSIILLHKHKIIFLLQKIKSLFDIVLKALNIYNIVNFINILYVSILKFYNPKKIKTNTFLKYDTYKIPNINLLNHSTSLYLEKKSKNNNLLFEINDKKYIENILSEYKINAKVVNIISGPVITRFELILSPGTISSKISKLNKDLARSLSTESVRIIEIIPYTPYLGLEIPNKIRSNIYIRDIIESKIFQNNPSPLSIALGKNSIGEPIIITLDSLPHLLIAGSTGSGKSITIQSIIISILYKSSPETVKFIMIDPKILELSIYSEIPHLIDDIIINTQDTINILTWCIQEMNDRYKNLSILKSRNIQNYNNKITCNKKNLGKKNKSLTIDKENDLSINEDIIKYNLKYLPYIVIIIDEFSDLIMSSVGKKIENLIICIAQKSRAAGIHLILSTQRPSVNIITGTLKSNISARIALSVPTKIDSLTILDQIGAESLLGNGDMLYRSPHSTTLTRIHGSLITDSEISSIIEYIKNTTNSSL